MAKNKPRRAILLLLFRFVSLLILIVPLRLGLILGQAAGRFCFYILKKEREKALDNLDIAFGDSKSGREKTRIARGVFENLGKNFIEVISIPKFSKDCLSRYIVCKGIDILQRFINEGKGLIIVSAHLGNWELLAHYISIKGFPLSVIARRVRMHGLEIYLSRIREKNRVNVIYRDASIKEIAGVLRHRGLVGIMPDQDMDSVSGVFVDFFERQAWTPIGASVLNILTEAPVIPCFIVRRKFGNEILIEEPIELQKTGDRQRDILENTQRYTRVIENYIRSFPEQWVWFHDRWKTKPSELT